MEDSLLKQVPRNEDMIHTSMVSAKNICSHHEDKAISVLLSIVCADDSCLHQSHSRILAKSTRNEVYK